MEYIPPRDALTADEAYRDENPTAGISGSVVGAKFFNVVQAEILKVIREGLGAEAPTDANHDQLYEAILALIAEASGEGGEGGGPWALAARAIAAGAGLSGGGNLSADRELKLAIDTLAALSGALADEDSFPLHDASVPGDRRITWALLKVAIAEAVAGASPGIPAFGAVGSYIFTRLGSGVTIPSVGATVSGSLFDPTRVGTWRYHGGGTFTHWVGDIGGTTETRPYGLYQRIT